MIEYFIGQLCRYSGLIVTIRSLRASDGRYLVEDATHSFFHVGHQNLSPLGIGVEKVDRSLPFEVVASQAAHVSTGRKRKAVLR